MSDLRAAINQYMLLRKANKDAAHNLREFCKTVLVEFCDDPKDEWPTQTQALSDKAETLLQEAAFRKVAESE